VDSSPGRSFWYLKSRVFLAGLAREVQKREAGSIRSERYLRGGSGGPELDSGISVFFHLNHVFLTF